MITTISLIDWRRFESDLKEKFYNNLKAPPSESLLPCSATVLWCSISIHNVNQTKSNQINSWVTSGWKPIAADWGGGISALLHRGSSYYYYYYYHHHHHHHHEIVHGVHKTLKIKEKVFKKLMLVTRRINGRICAAASLAHILGYLSISCHFRDHKAELVSHQSSSAIASVQMFYLYLDLYLYW